ncbi:MAG: hypothetical protein NXI04_13660 [Planctomycetaceae bacterium]|nr:hypothetical protein [Planctomycetaceae bacterium]
MSEQHQRILAYFDQLIDRDDMTSVVPFRAFLLNILGRPDVQRCHADVSLTSVVLCWYPRRDSRHKPVLCCRPATSRNMVIEFQITESLNPLRRVTRSTNCRYDLAVREFEIMWDLFQKTFPADDLT